MRQGEVFLEIWFFEGTEDVVTFMHLGVDVKTVCLEKLDISF